MQATEHRSDAHAEALADSMAGWLCRRRDDLRWRVLFLIAAVVR